MDDIHYYEVNLLWDAAKQGRFSSPANTSETTAPPKAAKGKREKWTLEHLFVAAINSCLMSTFLLVADDSKFNFISFESNAVGKIEKVAGKLSVTEIVLEPTLTIPSKKNELKAKRALELSEKAFAIANSTKTKITLEPNIIVQ